MSPATYSVLHVAAGFLLLAITFRAFAHPVPESKRSVLAWSGIASLVMLVAGFGLLAKLKYGFPGWIVVKLVCWLGLSALAGVAYRKPGSTGALTLVAALLVVVAIYMVYFRPF